MLENSNCWNWLWKEEYFLGWDVSDMNSIWQVSLGGHLFFMILQKWIWSIKASLTNGNLIEESNVSSLKAAHLVPFVLVNANLLLVFMWRLVSSLYHYHIIEFVVASDHHLWNMLQGWILKELLQKSKRTKTHLLCKRFVNKSCLTNCKWWFVPPNSS